MWTCHCEGENLYIELLAVSLYPFYLPGVHLCYFSSGVGATGNTDCDVISSVIARLQIQHLSVVIIGDFWTFQPHLPPYYTSSLAIVCQLLQRK